MTIGDTLQIAPSLPHLDREVLLAALLGCTREFLLSHPEQELTLPTIQKYQNWIMRRTDEEPVAYIIGEKEFFGLLFSVNRHTLIPRPETEILVESALNYIQKLKQKNRSQRVAIIDVGTGSGCIIISIVKFLQSSVLNHQCSVSFFAVDISRRALTVAIKNAQRHNVLSKITFVQSNLLESITEKLQSYDELMIIANLPYLSTTLYQNTPKTVHDFEPSLALESGKDGLDHYRRLFFELRPLSQTKKVHFFLEISPEQSGSLKRFLQQYYALSPTVFQDLAGKKRVLIGTFSCYTK